MTRTSAATIVGSLMIGSAAMASAQAPAPPRGSAKSVVVQPAQPTGEPTTGEPQAGQLPADVPAPARPNPAKKNNFFPLAGLGLVAAGVGTGAAIIASDNNGNPASP